MPDQRAGFPLTRLAATNLQRGVEAITVVAPITHGVECYEAWRDESDCPHEQEARHGA